ncbi:hypothetical protein [Mycolicibacterium gilvum]
MKVFADAEASAETNDIRSEGRDGYVLAYVAAAFGVELPRHTDRVARLLP